MHLPLNPPAPLPRLSHWASDYEQDQQWFLCRGGEQNKEKENGKGKEKGKMKEKEKEGNKQKKGKKEKEKWKKEEFRIRVTRRRTKKRD